MFGLDPDSSRWLCIYFPVSWATQLGHGMVTTVVGPTQPYLARNTGVSIDTVNFTWTFGFLGFLLSSGIAGLVFKKYLRTSRSKLIFLFSTIFSSGVLIIILPFTSSFPVLVTGRLLQHFAIGAFITADASLIVYLIGPEKSRPFTNALHAVIGAGFLVATFLVRPFLPSEHELDKAVICGRNANSTQETSADQSINNLTLPSGGEAALVPTIAWPFIISGGWCMITSLGFLILAFLPYKMPRYYAEEEDSVEKSERQDAITTLSRGAASSLGPSKLFLPMVFLFYFVSCGIERIYQPMATTFGLCGPLDLSPREAVLTDSFYNGGFMCGRIVSAVIATLVCPRNMVLISLVVCVITASILCTVGGTYTYGLYFGTCLLGFFVSWQFGSCFSWVAKHVNVTGPVAAVFFIGCGFGSLATPPLSGFIFTSSLGPMSIMYLTLAFCLLQCILFLSLWLLARRARNQAVISLNNKQMIQMETQDNKGENTEER